MNSIKTAGATSSTLGSYKVWKISLARRHKNANITAFLSWGKTLTPPPPPHPQFDPGAQNYNQVTGGMSKMIQLRTVDEKGGGGASQKGREKLQQKGTQHSTRQKEAPSFIIHVPMGRNSDCDCAKLHTSTGFTCDLSTQIRLNTFGGCAACLTTDEHEQETSKAILFLAVQAL